jgi:hypothetical protein
LSRSPVSHSEYDDGDHNFSDGYAGWRGPIPKGLAKRTT